MQTILGNNGQIAEELIKELRSPAVVIKINLKSTAHTHLNLPDYFVN
jgi:hypothetical protein